MHAMANPSKAEEIHRRLIQFGARTTCVAKMLPRTNEGRYISQQLMRSGLAAAPNYAEAMQRLAANADTALILLDLTLPDREGFAVLAELRGRYPETAVVVLSAEQNPETVRRALELGINFFDSAAKYNDGQSDACYGKAISAAARKNILLMSKAQLRTRDEAMARLMSLAAADGLNAIRDELKLLADPEIRATLDRVPGAAAATRHGPEATLTYSQGSPTAGSRFAILRPHARGGLGQISVALDAELNREVALKELRPERADDPDSRARFLLEAEITGRLEHPGVVAHQGPGGDRLHQPLRHQTLGKLALRVLEVEHQPLMPGVEGPLHAHHFHLAQIAGLSPGDALIQP